MPVSVRPYEVYSDCVAHGGKEKSGDSWLVRRFEEPDVLLLLVADGVGSHRFDWRASRTACQVTADVFESAQGPREERLRQGMLRAHTEIRGATGESAGMLSTLVAVVWEVSSDRILYASVGDSTIYRFTGHEALPLTHPDRGRMLLRRNNEIVHAAGAPVFVSGLTRSMGQPDSLKIEVHEHAFEKAESLALATDGLHEATIFPAAVRQAIEYEDPSSQVQSIVREGASQNQDDATLVVLRRNDIPETDRLYREALEHGRDYREQGLFGHIMLQIVMGQLRRAVAATDGEVVERCVSYLDSYSLHPCRDSLIAVLDEVVSSPGVPRSVTQGLRSLIGRAGVR